MNVRSSRRASFCDPRRTIRAAQYDEKSCRKSYMLMRDFFADTL